jgi:hypothetical protein
MLNLDGDLTSTRDLRVYPDSTAIGRLAYTNRKFLLGVPVGVERDRTMSTVVSLTPVVASWFRPRFLSSSAFHLSRTFTSREPVREDGDSGAFILPQTLNNSRTHEIGASLDFALGFRRLVGDSSFVGKALARVRPLDLSTRMVRTSTFDLTAFDPSLSYQLALGGLQDFLAQNGAAALGASEGRVATLAGGADLPYGFSFSLSHGLSRTTRFLKVNDRFIETETRQEEWPAGTIRWSKTFNRGALALVALGTAFRHRDGSSLQANQSGAPAETATSSSSINPDLQLALRNGIALTFGLNALNQRNAFNGNETDLEQKGLSGSFNYGFRLPRLLSHLRKQARTSLTLLSTKTRSCLQQSNLAECIPVSDVSRHEFTGGIDADFLQTMSGGLQINYSINDAKHLNRRTSQMSIIASFQLSLFAGDYR